MTQKGEVLPASRSTAAPTRFVIPFAATTSGFDTEITISNTSLGTAPQAGTCVLTFYGSGAPGAGTTASILAGKQIVIQLSQGGSGIAAAPNFLGYIMGSCAFPLARAYAKVFAAGHLAFSDETQLISTPRSTASPTRLLFPFFTNQGGFDSGITIANTSLDPFGTAATSGTCTLNFYGSNAPAARLTSTISAGSVYVTLASTLAPGFQGYAIATCSFTGAIGTAFVSDLGARNIAVSETSEVLTLPRGTTLSPLLISAVTNQNGSDTGIAIANTSADPFGTVNSQGSCSLYFYGQNAPATAVVTGAIPAGTVYTTLVSLVAPGFKGYVIASCAFPHARGWSFTGPAGLQTDGDSETAELTGTNRFDTAKPLLFSAVSNWYGADTGITISNTTMDPLGTAQVAGACTINYFGDMASGGSVPAPQTSTSIPAGGQLTFTLSLGNAAQGIAGAPGFRGYIIADCNFFAARGMSTIVVAPSSLSISKTRNGDLTQGQTNVSYTLTVSNAAAAGPTGGTITVTETPPAGLAMASMSGSGWTCGTTACTRSDILLPGASYPPITVLVNVSSTAGSPQVNQVSVTGGGSITATASDSAPILAVTPIGVSPGSGTGATQTFTATYSAGNGFGNLRWVQMLLAVSPDGGGQSYCFVHYDIAGNGLWLYGDGGFFVGPVTPGTPSNILQNSLCALNTSGSSVSGAGTVLTLKANLVFKQAAARNIYMRATTTSGVDSGWMMRGSWNLTAATLGIMSVSPSSGSGAAQTFALTYPDPPGFAGAAFGWVQFLVAAATNGGGQPFCFVHYDRAGNGLWMYSSDVGFFVGPVAPGTVSNVLNSSACSINTGAATVTNIGGNLVVNVPITMKSPMSGGKLLFQRTLDVLTRDTGWQQSGTWTIP